MTSTNTAPAAPATVPALIDGRYRVLTVAHLPFDALPAYADGGPATVTVGPWGVSTSSLSRVFSSPSVVATDDGKTTLNVYRFEDGASIKHELDGTKYDADRDASRAGYNAGVLGFMYERDRERLGIAFRVTAHRDADGLFCRVSGCDVVPPEQRGTNPNRCPAGCPDSGIEVYVKDDLYA